MPTEPPRMSDRDARPQAREADEEAAGLGDALSEFKGQLVTPEMIERIQARVREFYGVK